MLEDLPHEGSPGIFVGDWAAQRGTREVGKARWLGKGKFGRKSIPHLQLQPARWKSAKPPARETDRGVQCFPEIPAAAHAHAWIDGGSQQGKGCQQRDPI